MGQSDENRKERKTEIIGHRKQLLPSFLIISSDAQHETAPSRSSSPPSHLHTSPHARSARHRPFRLPPRPPCRRAGRDDTASKQHQHRHLITHSRRHRPHLIRSRRTDRQGQTIARQGTGTSRRTSTPSPPPSKQDGMLDATASPLSVANRREARTERD